MKVAYVLAKSNLDVLKVVKLAKLPKKVGLVTTIQFLGQLDAVKEYLEGRDHEVFIGGQVLGCDAGNAKKIANKVDAFLYVGSGEFHPLRVLIETGKKVIVANPISREVGELSNAEIKEIEKKVLGKYNKFLHAEKIGILVSTKPGQYNLDKAFELKKSLDKESYIFIGNEIRVNELEDFNDIDFWVNTACPRIEDRNVISLEDLEKYK
ncbi:MAG: diphthamide synthesis protein [Nanoarchaeota archaeon]|nr:diphthamide synthesis protein [Nanoarchaeota archaeon]MBU1445570.1 diphthamide synthesis protein [Nanoarchaeota archaeon]MBU2406394.1 diphthamide synthesis protein [Nanoarchaeota archaeon]MBU2420749.1 diphthamide synthesis protein [Nanoarchaeota archaeon]MBU2475459.1 diphthamide synthesis protein [Nanoarchaeota archaeon]